MEVETTGILGWWCQQLLHSIFQQHITLWGFSILLLIIWAAWRVIRFTLTPKWHPEEPPEVPYLIPCQCPSATLATRQQLGNIRTPFAFTIIGAKFYVISDAKHAAEVDKNTSTLSFEEFVLDFLRNTGLSESAIQACYFQKLPNGAVDFPNTAEDPIGLLIHQMHMHELYPGDKQKALVARFLYSFNRDLQIDQIRAAGSPMDDRTGVKEVTVSLYKWCAHFFTRAGGYAYFGDDLSRIDPDFADAFYTFDELSWQINYRIPEPFSKDMRAAKNHLHRSLKKYIMAPKSERSEQTWLLQGAEAGLRAMGVQDDDIATLFLTMYMTINTNTRRTTFWMLAFLLHNASLIETIRQETAQAFEGGELVNHEHLVDHSLCPHLEAVWLETLRLISNGSAVRCVNEDTVVGDMLFRKGNKVIIPYRLLHMSENAYKQDPEQFIPSRFLEKENRTRGGYWRPFGGGKTLCTGRFVAEQSIKACVCTILHRFDLEIIGGVPLPEGDVGTPGLGIMGIKAGEDFSVRISERA
ncbi:unnamed protein product [Clonostachys chloroleuca]|uniref:Cytochrome P450 n=1 Tax=Clonostachys chloroleuca TaxID=1926264 RepID=A0AA35M0B1_9HYPO|nr:unnamed protein product [Clonostachys chloroleuca]